MGLSIFKGIAARTAILLAVMALIAALAACSGDDDDAPADAAAQATADTAAEAQAAPEPRAQAQAQAEAERDEPLRVVATTSFVADWVENVGGDHVDVFSLVPVGADPHAFQPGAQDVARVADADLVLSVGLSLEEAWLLDLLENAASDPDKIVALGELIDAIEFVDSHAGDMELLEGIDHVIHEVEDGEIDAATGLAEIAALLDAAEEAMHHDEHEDHDEDEGHDEDEDHADEHDHHTEEELREILAAVDAGTMDAEEAIEEIHHLTIDAIHDLTEEGEDADDAHAGELELLEDIDHVVHEVEDGEIDAATGLAEIAALLDAAEEAESHEGHDDDEEEHEDHDEEGHDDDEEHEAHDDEHDHHGEDLHEMIREILAAVDAGTMDAEEAIEEIHHLTVDAMHDMDEEGEDEHDDHDDHGHAHGLYDPHFWFDPIRVQVAINEIADLLSALDPARSDDYRANADAYNAQLDELHAWTEEQVSTIPMERRLLVTSHDSLGYFAARYGFEVVGTVIPSFGTDVEPSAEDLAALTDEVREHGVPAVFGETTVSERLAAAVAAETGAVLVQLYSGSLGIEGSGGETYIGMVRSNVERITAALR